MLSWPHLIMFSFRMEERERITSLETRRLSLVSMEANKVDLPPGAAHKSSTRIEPEGISCFSICWRNMEEASCT